MAENYERLLEICRADLYILGSKSNLMDRIILKQRDLLRRCHIILNSVSLPEELIAAAADLRKEIKELAEE